MPSLIRCVFVSLSLYNLSFAQSSCLASCPPQDVVCQASCIQAPVPNSSLTDETTECVAKCDQGDGSPAAIQKYTECTQACISMLMASTAIAETTAAGDTPNVLTTTTKSESETGTATPEATPGSLNPTTTLQTSSSPSDSAKISNVQETGSSSPAAQESKSSALSAGAGAGIGIGAFILIIALGIAVFILLRRRKLAKPPTAEGADIYSDKEVRNDGTNIHANDPWNKGVSEIYGPALRGEEMEDPHGLRIARDREGRSELKA